ncbi:Hypothetical predicted protein [Cloeon dipterum]|uniref:Uncharacterized protein n=1 Tax=Cloeon dipterum TaxID=197152 RepID=A0A8S1D5Z1_9INSE|nr:Hypothetical predicted protein [Cloeon dipterum]
MLNSVLTSHLIGMKFQFHSCLLGFLDLYYPPPSNRTQLSHTRGEDKSICSKSKNNNMSFVKFVTLFMIVIAIVVIYKGILHLWSYCRVWREDQRQRGPDRPEEIIDNSAPLYFENALYFSDFPGDSLDGGCLNFDENPVSLRIPEKLASSTEASQQFSANPMSLDLFP